MPTYEFVCEKCGATFEQHWTLAEYDRKRHRGLACVKCGSPKVARRISVFQVKTSRKS